MKEKEKKKWGDILWPSFIYTSVPGGLFLPSSYLQQMGVNFGSLGTIVVVFHHDVVCRRNTTPNTRKLRMHWLTENDAVDFISLDAWTASLTVVLSLLLPLLNSIWLQSWPAPFLRVDKGTVRTLIWMNKFLWITMNHNQWIRAV